MKVNEISRENTRNSNFELLRVISTLLIVLYHCNLHLNYNVDDSIWHGTLSNAQVLLTIFGSWGQVGANCFILISAYFLLDSNKIKTKNVLRIVLQTVFYSTFASTVLVGTGIVEFSSGFFMKNIKNSLIGGYWFVLAYILMYATFPFLNAGVHALNEKQLRYVCVLFIIVHAVLLSWLRYFNAVGTYTWFITIYVTMAYLKRSNNNLFRKYSNIGATLCFIANIAIILLFSYYNGYFATKINGLFHIGSPLLLVQSLFLFYLFENRKPSKVRAIDYIADCSLGVYLFHENYAVYANENNTGLIWDSIFGLGDSLNSNEPFFALRYFAAVLIVYAAAIAVDLVRKYMLEKPIFRSKIVMQLCNGLDGIIN